MVGYIVGVGVATVTEGATGTVGGGLRRMPDAETERGRDTQDPDLSQR